MGDQLATLVVVVSVLAAVVYLVFGRDASLVRGVRSFRSWRAGRAPTPRAPSEWARADTLVRKGEKLATDREAMRTLLDSERLADTLARIYPRHPLLELDGVRMPVWAVPVAPDQRREVSSILGQLSPASAPGVMTYPEGYCPGGAPTFRRKHEQRALLPEHERYRLASDPTYSLTQAALDPSGRVTLDCHMGRYFTYLATSRSLGPEFLGAMSDSSRDLSLASLPMRQWLHANVDDPVLDGSRRDAALGHCTLVVVRRRGGGYFALFPTRSKSTATDAFLMHVCPAGMMQPFSDSPIANVADFSIEANFSREYVEELYGEESAERPTGHFDVFDGSSHLPLTRLDDHFRATPGSSLQLTGFCVNLLTLQPEVCLLLFIDDPDWLYEESNAKDFPLKFGWEIADVADHPQSWLLSIDEEFNLQTDGPLRPGNLVPQAAAALKLGLDLLRLDEGAVTP